MDSWKFSMDQSMSPTLEIRYIVFLVLFVYGVVVYGLVDHLDRLLVVVLELFFHFSLFRAYEE